MLFPYLAQVVLTSFLASPCPASQDGLYAPRALRRVRAELAMQLREARRARLAAARQAIFGHISVDELLALPDDAAIVAQGPHDAHLKHLSQSGATICR
jgi:hypothetical protein